MTWWGLGWSIAVVLTILGIVLAIAGLVGQALA